MNPTLLSKVADVLDAVAEENEKQAAELKAVHDRELTQRLDPVINKLAGITGDSREELKTKLAEADPDMVALLDKLAGETNFDELGSATSEKTASARLSGSERATRAHESFGNWITS